MSDILKIDLDNAYEIISGFLDVINNGNYENYTTSDIIDDLKKQSKLEIEEDNKNGSTSIDQNEIVGCCLECGIDLTVVNGVEIDGEYLFCKEHGGETDVGDVDELFESEDNDKIVIFEKENSYQPDTITFDPIFKELLETLLYLDNQNITIISNKVDWESNETDWEDLIFIKISNIVELTSSPIWDTYCNNEIKKHERNLIKKNILELFNLIVLKQLEGSNNNDIMTNILIGFDNYYQDKDYLSTKNLNKTYRTILSTINNDLSNNNYITIYNYCFKLLDLNQLYSDLADTKDNRNVYLKLFFIHYVCTNRKSNNDKSSLFLLLVELLFKIDNSKITKNFILNLIKDKIEQKEGN